MTDLFFQCLTWFLCFQYFIETFVVITKVIDSKITRKSNFCYFESWNRNFQWFLCWLFWVLHPTIALQSQTNLDLLYYRVKIRQANLFTKTQYKRLVTDFSIRWSFHSKKTVIAKLSDSILTLFVRELLWKFYPGGWVWYWVLFQLVMRSISLLFRET